MENVRDLRPEVRQTLERAEQFLGLAALVAVILAAVAVALAASRYLRRHLDAAAMLRCFGASRRQALALFVMQFVALGVARERRRASRSRSLGQSLLVALLDVGRARRACRRRDCCPASTAFGTGVLLLFGFALPPLDRARERAAAARAAARPAAAARRAGSSPICSGAGVIALLIAWQAQDAQGGRDHGRRHRRLARRRGVRRVGADRRC